LTPYDHQLSETEWALVNALRIVNRLLGPGVLSPVERAFVAGAKDIFDNLSKACESVLNRKLADLVAARADPAIVPGSVGPRAVAARASSSSYSPEAPQGRSPVAAPADGGGSITERLTRVERTLSHLAQFVGQQQNPQK
jgi:hypothetical protein